MIAKTMYGHKGDALVTTTENPLLDFFSKAGSFTPDETAYHGETVDYLGLFIKAWEFDPYKAMQLLFWLRNCRGGAGNRKYFNLIMSWVARNGTEWITANLALVPQYGRWDDLTSLIGTDCEKKAISFWASAIMSGDRLACKWAPREKNMPEVFKLLRKEAKLNPKEFRKIVARNTDVVETKMCNNQWDSIDFNKVPSVAMARRFTLFYKRNTVRFLAWRESLADPESENKVNASVLFPHDCIRTLNASGSTDTEGSLANAQFAALPNYMEKSQLRIMSIMDSSDSMGSTVSSGSIAAIDIAKGLALYCSDKIGKDSPFYRKYIPFSDNARFVDWKDKTFSQAVKSDCDGYCGSTNVASALDLILSAAKTFSLKDDQLPNCLLILSDMQFDQGCSTGGYNYGKESQKETDSAIQSSLNKWVEAGYSKPKIVYWDLVGYEGYGEKRDAKNVAMVSGFSPSVLKAILDGEDFSPEAIMYRTIAEYEVVNPFPINI